MNFLASLFGGGSGGSGSAPGTAPGVGGSGKGASGAANFTGDNSAVFGNKTTNSPWIAIAAIAAVVFFGLFAWRLSKH